ncbi:MAG: aspartate carbamoyltransferase [Dehalococcoidia bacterium]
MPETGSTKPWWLAAALLVGVFAVGGIAFGVGRLTAGGGSESDLGDRQADVAERGATVMPFDLERTTHVFSQTADGGLQTVTADDPQDAEQVRLIREHLKSEAARFAAGDFSDPAQIHGSAMPGLAELSAAGGAIEIEYSDVPDGAAIRYATEDPALASALHRWFDAQVSDHGDHAHDGSMR